ARSKWQRQVAVFQFERPTSPHVPPRKGVGYYPLEVPDFYCCFQPCRFSCSSSRKPASTRKSVNRSIKFCLSELFDLFFRYLSIGSRSLCTLPVTSRSLFDFAGARLLIDLLRSTNSENSSAYAIR